MSSYQFVNSLSSCYGPGRAGPDGGVSAGPPAEYYSQQVYNSWSGANPATSNVVSAAAAAAVAAVGQSPASPPYSAYLQQNGDHHNSHHLPHHRDLYNSNTCSQQAALVGQSRLSHHSSQLMQPTRTSSSPSSCKFGLDPASSPQDLSTSSGGAGQSPEPRTASPRVQGNSNQNSSQQSSNSTGNSNSQNKGGNFNSSNPPHIYPWMRKVHVGQSEYCYYPSYSYYSNLTNTHKQRQKQTS